MPDQSPIPLKPGKNAVFVFVCLCAAGLLAAALSSLAAGKPGTLKLALIASAVLVSGGLFFMGWLNRSNANFSGRWRRFFTPAPSTILLITTGILALAGWVIFWTPPDRFGSLFYYIQAIQPFALWLAFASLGALGLLLAARTGFIPVNFPTALRKYRSTILVVLGVLLVFGLSAWAASLRILHVNPADEDFWYGAGAPVLAFQVLAALVGGLVISWFIKKLTGQIPALGKHIDLVTFLAIWAFGAWLWAATPVRADFLVTKPVAPNFEMYPDYDARNYDLMSQFALIGQGINNHSFFDRVLYPAFLVYLHTLAGQDYSRVMALQAAVFAVLAAFLYLAGSRLHSRAAGLVLAILVALRGASHIDVGNLIETAHPKYMLTEYPTAVILVILCFMLIEWLRNPARRWPLAGLAGAIISLSTLLRPHPLVFLPVVIVLVILVYRRKARVWAGLSTLVVTCAFLALLPWLQFGGQNVSIISLYMTRIRSTIEERYPQLLGPQGGIPSSQASPHLAQIAASAAPDKSVIAFASDHFLNNLVTSVLVLPTSPYNLEARVVVKKTESFWKPYWDGSLSPWARLLLMINLGLLALGLAAAWRRARLAGLLPLILMLAYFAVNALGRTSGGRYLVPVDWVVILYYVIGLLALGDLVRGFFFQLPLEPVTPGPVTAPPVWRSTLITLLVSAALGGLVPLSQVIHPAIFVVKTKTGLAAQFVSQSGGQPPVSEADIARFLSDENAVILEGRNLYPRQFNQDEGLDISIYTYYRPLPYPRTIFTVIGSTGAKAIVLPATTPADIANSSNVMVLGCKADGYVQAWAVLNLSANKLYTALPDSGAPPGCPLPAPICDNNGHCR